MATTLPQLVIREAEPPEADTSAYACILRDEPLCSLNDVRSGLPISGRPLQPHAQQKHAHASSIVSASSEAALIYRVQLKKMGKIVLIASLRCFKVLTALRYDMVKSSFNTLIFVSVHNCFRVDPEREGPFGVCHL